MSVELLSSGLVDSLSAECGVEKIHAVFSALKLVERERTLRST